jgi:alpha/beta superfamily hydrolase
MTRPASERILIEGAAGAIETVIDFPEETPLGIALVAHPNPLLGGTLDNKVAKTLARVFYELGYVSLRPNFRGVGASQGVHDEGRGETDDMLTVLDYARGRFGTLPIVLGGFSFGSFIQSHVAKRIAVERMVLIGTAAGRMAVEQVPADTIVIHGELDEVVPLSAVFDWARPQDLPVVVIPGADHFFHRRLHIIRNIVTSMWRKPGFNDPAA